MTAFQQVRLSADKSELFVMASGATSAWPPCRSRPDPDSRARRFAAWDRPFEIDLSPGTVRRIPAGVPVPQNNADGGTTWCSWTRPGRHRDLRTPRACSWDPRPGTAGELPAYSSDYPNLRDALASPLGAAGNRRPPSPWCPPAGCSPCSTTRPPPTACPHVRGTGPKGNRAGSSCGADRRSSGTSSQHNDDNSLAKRDAYRRRHGAPRAAVGVGARVMARHPGGQTLHGMLAAPLALIVLAVLMAVL